MKNKAINSGQSALGDVEPTANLDRNGVGEVSNDLRRLLADVFALY